MSERLPPLPGELGDIARIAGREAAEALGRKLGGTRVYFPCYPDRNHWLSQLVGIDAALKICEELTGGFPGGRRVDLPNGPFGHQEGPRAKVDRMIREGASERDIALAARYTERGVRKRKAKLRDSRQGDLFHRNNS